MKNEIDFKKVVENIVISLENKKEIESAITDTIVKFPNYTKEYIYLRLIQSTVNNIDFSDKFKLQTNQQINRLIQNLDK
jgi:hypothetical protein